MFNVSNHYFSKSIFLLLFIETVVTILSVYAGAKIRFYERYSVSFEFLDFLGPAVVVTCAMIFSLSALGMYQKQVNAQIRSVMLRLAPAFILCFCIISVVFYVAPYFQVGRGALSLMLVLAAIGLVTTRLIFLRLLESRIFISKVLFLGAGKLAKECGDLAKSRATTGRYKVAGYIPIDSEATCVSTDSLLKKECSLYQTAKANNATDIVVALQEKRGASFPIQELLECKLHGIRITDSATFFEREACQIRIGSLHPSWLIFGGGFDQSFSRAFCKRAFDLAVSLVLAIITFPIVLITALLIYIEDAGPIIYSQERVGRNGKRYFVYKFRSMRTNAEQAGKPQWASENDPRVTKVGAIIRKLRIDELPQLFNVLVGDMSFVGPRPERPYFVEELCQKIPFYDARHSVKPGITGMAQVRYPYGASVDDAIQKLQYDLYYVKNNSLFLDVLILIDTIQVVLIGKGAR